MSVRVAAAERACPLRPLRLVVGDRTRPLRHDPARASVVGRAPSAQRKGFSAWRSPRTILEEIRRTTRENGGRPLGRKSFEQATGISPYEWGRYWARFGDALRDAGFQANQLNEAFPDSLLLEALAGLVRELGRIPSVAELRLARTHDPSFPSEKVFARLGRRNERLGRQLTFCEEANDYADVAAIAAAAYRPDYPAETAERAPTGAVS